MDLQRTSTKKLSRQEPGRHAREACFFMFAMNRRELAGALLLAVLLVAGLLLRFTVFAAKTSGPEIIPPGDNNLQEKKREAEIFVHVAGAVRRPGVYTLPAGARVIHALEAAGGVLPDGDEHALNLAEPLYDGRHISVPYLGQEAPAAATEGKVNINTATAEELDRLPGIGPAKAAAIVAYREKNGPFQSLEDLVNVSGIGPSTVETLKEYVTLY
ncbi:MAG TPA: ComEA family DNA-binding protein [Firmicutes bacterium]|nr:ComEA family DNA-binding protein [Bacillota bacterium]